MSRSAPASGNVGDEHEHSNVQRHEGGQGAAADVCIFDPDAYRFFSEKDMISRGRNTPFSGWELRGRVTHTLMGGVTVYKCP